MQQIKAKRSKNHNVNHKKPIPSTYLLQSLEGQLLGHPFPYRFFKAVKGLAFYRNNIPYFWS